ncbi:type 4a pilus biogenesis protein PilO [Candidatus Omnitrophota bacterium]
MDIYLKRILRWEWVGVVIIACSVVAADVNSNLSKIQIIQKEIEIERADARAMDPAEIARIERELKAEVEELKSSITVFKNAARVLKRKVNKEQNIAVLTQEIVKIADVQQIDLSLVKPLSAKQKNEYEIMPISMQFQAEYENLFKFLNAIETSTLLAGVGGFTVSYNSAMDPLLDIQLTVYVLFETKEEDVAPNKRNKR